VSGDLVFTADELAAKLGVDRKTVYDGASRGVIPCRRLGRRVLFPRAAIERWLEESKQ
jgi:excisionase family DNA binding protein